MPRVQGTLLTEHQNNNKIEKVILSDGIYAVLYNNKPFNLRVESTVAFEQVKYKKVSFSNKGPAINLAKKLNKQFDTDLFTVVLFGHGKTIYPD